MPVAELGNPSQAPKGATGPFALDVGVALRAGRRQAMRRLMQQLLLRRTTKSTRMAREVLLISCGFTPLRERKPC